MKTKLSIMIVAVAALAFVAQAREAGMNSASNWVYQLQDADPAALAASNYDVVVMDYSRDGTDAGAYTFQEIRTIRNSGKIVLAYFSIGEAENYRFYWKPWWKPGNPVWLGPENPDWPGNFAVRYWNAEWWEKAVGPYLQKILAAGFDGVYMDLIDAYWYWHAEGGRSLDFTVAKMIALVSKIGVVARSKHGDFILCPQNGESVIDDAPTTLQRNKYLNTINAIGVEDLFYHSTVADRNYRKWLLNQYAAAGKKVFSVEYIQKSKWAEYRGKACAAAFEPVPYGAAPDRALNEITGFKPGACPSVAGDGP